jgi:hypothetical protein
MAPSKLIIVVEILPHLGEDSQRVKREFETELSPRSNCFLKLLGGPPRTISYGKLGHPIPCDPAHKIFSALIESGSISYFPEQNTTTIIFYDHLCLLTKKKVSTIVSEYLEHDWIKQP